LSYFDTCEFIKNLEKSGIPESQAKAICDGFKECHYASDHVSKADMECLESRLERKISDTAHRQTKVIGTMIVGSITLLTLFDRCVHTTIASLTQSFWS
jgi:enhancing lycopene biosynthesis protein 2